MKNPEHESANFVLIVEDEPFIRQMAAEVLVDAGFAVREAANADEAVNILETHNDIAIVFADINIPGSIDGMALAETIRKRWPQIEILLTSGQTSVRARALPARALYLPKPYQVSKLLNILEGFLGSAVIL